MRQSKYHTRHNYETLYKRLMGEAGKDAGDASDLPFRELIASINVALKLYNCEPFTFVEMAKLFTRIKQ